MSSATNSLQPPRLFLAFPEGAALGDDARLASVLRDYDVACLLLRGLAPGENVAGVAQAIQSNGTALVFPYREVTAGGAEDEAPGDGYHLDFSSPHVTDSETAIATYEAARQRSGDGIVGCALGDNRHLAMELSEAGADYVAFSLDARVRLLDLGDGDDTAGTATDDTIEVASADAADDPLIAWWAEVFQVPVVAWGIATLADADKALDMGADFIALEMPPRMTPDAQDLVVAVADSIERRLA